MKLRHLLSTAAVTALAVTPLAFTSAASGAFDAHSYRFDDNTEDTHIVPTIDITKVHLYRTAAGDFRAVVSYKDLVKRPATKWIVTFQDDFWFANANDAKKARAARGIMGVPQGVAMEYRIGPDGKTAAFGYQYDFFDAIGGGQLRPTVCKGFAAKPDFAADTIMFSIPRQCWTVSDDPAQVGVGTRLFKKSEWRSNLRTYDGAKDRYDDAYGYWSWGGTPVELPRQGTPLDRNPFFRK